MIERVVENWLTNVNERSFEIPFCQLLTSEGYEVVHMSRHGPFEQGKDVIAIAPDGTPCAYQLKGAPKSGRITQTQWAREYQEQAVRLIEIPIRHPAIDRNLPRRVFFVTNGELDEEVRVEIADRNLDAERRNLPILETVCKEQLLSRFLKIHTNFWPSNLETLRELLEFFLVDGKDCLNKGKFAQFLEAILISTSQTSKSAHNRLLCSVAVLTSYGLSAFEAQENHVAVFEGWTIYIATLTALVEKESLPKKYWKPSLDIANTARQKALIDLCLELNECGHFVEGNVLYDQPFYRGRITWLVGLVSALALSHQQSNFPLPDKLDGWFKDFVRQNKNKMEMWGEGAVPQFLSLIWYLETITATLEPVDWLTVMIKGISESNRYSREKKVGLPDPYIGFPEVIEIRHGIGDTINRYDFAGLSYTLDGLMQLLAKRNWRRRMADLWPNITRLQFVEFVPENSADYCLWHLDKGNLKQTMPSTPQSWQALRQKAEEINCAPIPQLFVDSPELLLYHILVYPHRCTSDIMKYLDSMLGRGKHN